MFCQNHRTSRSRGPSVGRSWTSWSSEWNETPPPDLAEWTQTACHFRPATTAASSRGTRTRCCSRGDCCAGNRTRAAASRRWNTWCPPPSDWRCSSSRAGSGHRWRRRSGYSPSRSGDLQWRGNNCPARILAASERKTLKTNMCIMKIYVNNLDLLLILQNNNKRYRPVKHTHNDYKCEHSVRKTRNMYLSNMCLICTILEGRVVLVNVKFDDCRHKLSIELNPFTTNK